jgi:hypothetical protein
MVLGSPVFGIGAAAVLAGIVRLGSVEPSPDADGRTDS